MNASSRTVNWPNLESAIDFSPIVVPLEMPLIDAIALMGQAHRHFDSSAHPENVNLPQRSSCVLAVDKSQLVGIVTGQDALRFTAAKLDLAEIKVSEAMTQPVVALVQSPEQTVLSAWSLLRQHRICHLPIVNEQGGIVGLVTQNDLLQWVDPLERYTADSKPQNIRELQSALRESQLHELELLSDQRRLEAFFSQSPDGFFFMMLDRPIRWNDTVDQEALLDYVFKHQRVTKANAAMLAQYDATEDEYLGLTPQDFFAHDVETGRQLWREMFDKGRLHVETYERKLDGTSMWIEGDYSCLYNSDGEIIGHFGIQRDISEAKRDEVVRKQAEEELRQSQQDLTDFVENAIICLHWVASDGTIIWANQAELDLLGYTREEYIGHSITEFHANQTAIEDILQKLLSDQPVQEYETDLRCKDGSIRHVLIDSNSSWRNDKFVRTRCFTRDITDRKRAEEALRQSEQRFRAIFDGTFQFMGVLNPEGRLTEANRTAVDAIAANLEDVVGQLFWETPWWTHSPVLQEQLKQAIAKAAKGELVRFEAEHLLADGTSVFVDFTLKPVFDESGKVIMLIPEGRDISDRKQMEEALRESEQRLQAMLNNSTAVIYMKDTQGRYIMINHSYEVLFHLDRNEVKGKTDHDIFPKAIADAFQANDREVIAAGIALEKEEVAPQDDGLHTFLSIKFPLFDSEGRIYAVCGMSTDISDRKQAEVALQNQKQDLARSNDELQQFAYVASHDLQEPLRMIASYLELLERRYKGQLDAKADKFIAYAVDGATRMQTLINDLLSYSRVGTRGQDWESVACQKIVKNVLTNLQVAIAQSNAMITHDSLPEVKADPSQLTQLFQNLISNAIKFKGKDPPKIHIGVKCTDGKWLFSVRDNGMGIDTQYMDRIFVIFQRLHSRTEYPGTGIGLAVCKKIVERHSGTLWVESQLNQGSTFYFTLPNLAGNIL
jgi:PAS domain S-box-containing protein